VLLMISSLAAGLVRSLRAPLALPVLVLALLCIFSPRNAPGQDLIRILSVDQSAQLKFPHITANVSVNSAHGLECRLNSSNFSLTEDGVAQDLTRVACVSTGSLTADIVVVFDDTGSMGEEIVGMKQRATEFADGIKAAGIDAHFALVTFKDTPTIVQYLDPDVKKFQDAVNTLYASGGGDIPEVPLDGIMKALQEMQFRQDAQKVFLVISDAPTHYLNDGTSFSSYYLYGVADAVNAELGTVYCVSPNLAKKSVMNTNDGGTQVYTPKPKKSIPQPRPDDEDDLRALAEVTGGLWIDIHGGQDFSAIIAAVAQSISAIYTVEYTTSNTERDGSDRAVRITVEDPLAGVASATASYLAPPANDNFADRIILTGPDWIEFDIFSGILTTNKGATKEPGEPNHAGIVGGASLWWQWTAPASGRYVFNTGENRGPDTVLAVYKGDSLSSLTLVASNDDYPLLFSAVGEKSLVVLNAEQGETFQIAVDTKRSETGVIRLWYYNFDHDNFRTARVITGMKGSSGATNVAATTEPNEPAMTTLSPTQSVWIKWTATETAPVLFYFSIKSTVPPFPAVKGYIAAYKGDTLGNLTQVGILSGVNDIHVDAVAGQTYYLKIDSPSSVMQLVSFNWDVYLPNDNFASRRYLTGSSGTLDGNNRNGTKESYEPNHAGEAGGHSAWYSWRTGSTSGWATVRVEATTMEPLLAAYRGNYISSLNNITSSSAPEDSWLKEARIVFPATETTYNIAVDSRGDGGAYALSWRVDTASSEDPYEDNDSRTQAVDLTTVTTTDREKLVLADEDWFKGSLPPHTAIRLATFFSRIHGDIDMTLYVGDVGSDVVTAQDASTTSLNYAEVDYRNTTTESKIYYVRIYGKGGASSPFYSLVVEEERDISAPLDAILSKIAPEAWHDYNGDNVIDAADLLSTIPIP
jgi:VWFA-related protein